MGAESAWTPAPRPGIIPLHPLTFGTILGRSFAALRHNPRVLLGFALGVQAISFLVLVVGVGATGWAAFSRLDTLLPGTDEWDAVMAGSVLVTGLVGVALGLLTAAAQVLVQAVVVGEVAHAVVAEKLTLGALWRQVRPAAWRLIGYSLLVLAAVSVLTGAVTAVVVAAAVGEVVALAVAIVIGAVLLAIPLALWLSTKLLLVPSALILEGATIRGAIARSWRLVRGRFWPTLGVIVVISVLFSVVGQLVQLPFAFLTAGLTTIFAPTGDPTAESVIGMLVPIGLSNILVLVVQAIAAVVQSTAAVLIYVDCRMRHEGLDVDLLTYVERRDAGAGAAGDPWALHRDPPPAPPAPPAPSWDPASARAHPHHPSGAVAPAPPPPLPYPVGAPGTHPSDPPAPTRPTPPS